MSFQPVLHPLVVLALTVPFLALAVWAAVTAKTPGMRGRWITRVVLVLACAGLMLRPGIPGGQAETVATSADIVVVVDETASIVAEDWDGGKPRLEGVRSDIAELMAAYPGARFALITFDSQAEVALPLTTDTAALSAALEVMRPEVTAQSRGSGIAVASPLLAETLRGAQQADPERSRMVFYFGDGEQTGEGDPQSFAPSAELISGGGVFGYGTDEGGPMRSTSAGIDEGEAPYIQYRGERARSVIDEQNLRTIAEQLGVEYQHRTAGSAPEFPPPPATTSEDSGTTGSAFELYWIIALLVAGLVAFEVSRGTMLAVRTLRLRRPAGAEGAPPGGAAAARPGTTGGAGSAPTHDTAAEGGRS